MRWGKSEEKREGGAKENPRTRARTLMKERSSLLTSVEIIDSTVAPLDDRVQREEKIAPCIENKYLDNTHSDAVPANRRKSYIMYLIIQFIINLFYMTCNNKKR